MNLRERDRLDLDAEREVDLGHVAASVAARWWLPFLGVLAGLVVGWSLSLGGSTVYRAAALVDPGTPFAVGGGLLPQRASPSNVRDLITSEEAIRRAAAASGMRPRELRGSVTLQQQAATPGARASANPVFTIAVQGPAPRRVSVASNELARFAIARLSRFTSGKITNLERQLAGYEQAMRRLDQSIEALTEALLARNAAGVDRLAVVTALGGAESRRATLEATRLTAQAQLEQAREYELPQLVARGVAYEVTARSRRNSMIVAATIGLILGLIAALAWEPLVERRRRR